jgi:hypothetical protein
MELRDLYDAVDTLRDILPEGYDAERVYNAFKHIDKIAFARGYNRCAADFNLGITIEPTENQA